MEFARLAAVGLALFSFLAGCGGGGAGNRYGEFSLPPAAGSSRPVRPRIVTPQAGAVMSPVAGTWEAVDVLNPSVVDLGAGKLLNVYSAYDGKMWHTGVATSDDGGVTWQRRGRVLSPAGRGTWEGEYIAANGSALRMGDTGEILYWYQAGSPPRIGLARSGDGGRTWSKLAEPVLGTGPRGSWDERGVADPYAIEAGDGTLYLFFLGQNRARQQRLGLARSTDRGVTWTKLRTNPILEIGDEGAFDENGLGEPAVWPSDGRWWMLYTGRDRYEARRIGLAWSTDGRKWQRLTEAAAMAGGEAWNAKVVCDPTVLPALNPGGPVRIWYGGGDVAHPAENIHGRIGYAELIMVPQE